MSSFSGTTVDLSSLSWTLGNGANVSNVTASFPSQAHLDLYRAGVIGDPLYGRNDYEQLWVQRSNWTYTSGPIGGLSTGSSGVQTWLLFEGLDTFAYVELCGQAVGNTDNQFRQYHFDVSNILKNCKQPPVLSLNFGSATKIVLDIARTGDGNVNFTNGITGKEFQGRVYVRKEQNDFGWDWSPSLAPAGPWKPASFIQTTSKTIYVRNTAIDIFRQGQMNNLPPNQSKPWVFNASLDVIGTLPKNSKLFLDLVDSSGRKITSGPLLNVSQNRDTVTGSVTIDPSSVQLWWPSGYGSQSLYNASIAVQDASGFQIASTSRRVGFRTIVLNLTPITPEQLAKGVAGGSNWHFEINGHEMYAKGSNFVPPDAFWPRVNQTKIQQLFELAKQGNQNMLRVWSSGAYLPDFIYDLADEMGILLWSEFEFTDAEYPTSPSEIANYQAEAYHNVRRVNHHPSLAVWVGGNELEQIQLFLGFDPGKGSYILRQYQRVFEELLIKCVYANSKSISYIPSSTYNGYLSLNFSSIRPQTPRYYNSSSNDDIYANSDYYDYDTSRAFDFSFYPVARFADEFGFHSMPSLESWQSITTNDQLTSIESDIVVHRNRHTGEGDTVEAQSLAGIAQMTGAIPQWLPTPAKSDHLANFSAWAYATQVFQADFLAHQIAFYRRGSGRPERQLGALYWQLNDLWVAPTWSSIEANGRQKLLYHTAKDLFSPVIVYPYYSAADNSLEVWATSDLWNPVRGTVRFEMFDYNGNAIKPAKAPDQLVQGARNVSSAGNSFDVPFAVGPINATRIASIANASALFGSVTRNGTKQQAPIDLSQALLRLSVTAAQPGASATTLPSSSSPPSDVYTHSSIFHPTSLNQTKFPDPGLRLTHGASAGGGGAVFTVTATKAAAAWINLEYRAAQVQGYFEDNGFWLAKGESRTVRFTVWNDWTGSGAWVNGVTVRSLWDLTTP